jgi:hypothetical protein
MESPGEARGATSRTELAKPALVVSALVAVIARLPEIGIDVMPG